MNKIKENYERIKKEKRMTDYAISKKSGLVIRTIYRFREDPECVRFSTIQKIAETLGCKVVDLIE